MTRALRQGAVHGVIGGVILSALLAWGGREVEFRGEAPSEAQQQAQEAGQFDRLIAEQVAALGCGTEPWLSPRVAVRNATGFDRGVVVTVPFDEGVELAEKGEVWVVGWC